MTRGLPGASAQDPVDRFLVDAERAAREGDRPTALDLILLALDTAPGNAAVLVRAHAVRNLLPNVGDAAARDEANGSPAPVPVFPDIQLEIEPQPSSARAQPRRRRTGTAAAPPASVRTGMAASPRPSRSTRSLASAAPDSAGRPGLLVLLGLMLLIGGLALWQPQWIEVASSWVGERGDPLAQAEEAYAENNLESALVRANEALADSANEHRVRLLMGRIYLDLGNDSMATEHLKLAASGDPQWESAFEAATLLWGLGDTLAAASAFLKSYEGGAPPGHWQRIADAQEGSGNQSAATYLRDLIWRTGPAVAEPPHGNSPSETRPSGVR